MSQETDPKVVEAVRAHPFFHGFDPAFVHEVCQHAREVRFEPDELLAKEGAPADVFYLILEGKVALEAGAADNPHLTVQTVGRDEVLGWSWLVAPHRWRFDARATKPVRAAALSAEVLRRTLASHPTWGYQFLIRFMPVLAERLENTRIQLLDLHAH